MQTAYMSSWSLTSNLLIYSQLSIKITITNRKIVPWVSSLKKRVQTYFLISLETFHKTPEAFELTF